MTVKGFKNLDEFLLESWKEATTLMRDINKQFSNVIQDIDIREHKDVIDLNFIVIKPEYRKQGYFDRIMEDIIFYSNKKQKPIILSPEDGYGTPGDILEKMYMKHGFQFSDDKPKLYAVQMIRYPDKLHESVIGDEAYFNAQTDAYWDDLLNKFPDYEKADSEDHKEAVNYILGQMKKQYDELEWEEIEADVKSKISDSLK